MLDDYSRELMGNPGCIQVPGRRAQIPEAEFRG